MANSSFTGSIGKTYLADVRAAFTIDSDASDPANLDLPINWDTLGDTPAYNTWQNVNVGEPGPTFGQALGTQIGQWAANYSGQSKWIQQFGGLLTPLLNQMVAPDPNQYKVSFSLNTLLAQEYGQSRVLLWREFEP